MAKILRPSSKTEIKNSVEIFELLFLLALFPLPLPSAPKVFLGGIFAVQCLVTSMFQCISVGGA